MSFACRAVWRCLSIRVSLAADRDGRHIVIGATNGGISLWDLQPTPRTIHAETANADWVSVAENAKNTSVASVGLGDPYLRLWSLTTLKEQGKPIPLVRTGGSDVAFALDDRAIAVSDGLGTISLFDMNERRSDPTLLQNATIPMTMSPDNYHMAVSSPKGFPEILNVGHSWSIAERVPDSSNSKILGIGVSPLGDLISVLHEDGHLTITNLQSKRMAERLLPHSRAVEIPVVFSSDGRFVAFRSDDMVCIYAVEGASLVSCPKVGFKMLTLKFNKEGTLLAVGGLYGDLMVLESSTGATQSRRSLGRNMRLDIGDGKPSDGLPVAVYSLAFRSDSQVLALGGSDGEIDIVASRKGQTVDAKPKHITAHTNAVFGLCFDPLGKS